MGVCSMDREVGSQAGERADEHFGFGKASLDKQRLFGANE
jgi:hypothetical protein